MNKFLKHWYLFPVAGFFELLGLIPFLCVITNFIFGMILFLYFGPKKFGTTIAIIAGGSIIDWIITVVPVCLGALIVRIILEKEPIEQKV